MKRILVVVAFVGLLGSWVGAQSNWEETKATPARPPHYGARTGLFAPLAGAGDRTIGIFPMGGKEGNDTMTSFLLQRFLFSGHGRRAAGARSNRFSLFGDRRGGYRGSNRYPGYEFPGSGFYPMFGMGDPYGPKPALYDSQRFVDEWKDRSPAKLSESRKSDLTESILLKEGMSEEDVVKAVGSPLQKFQTGEQTIWKYSGYSLLFEGGTLKDIR